MPREAYVYRFILDYLKSVKDKDPLTSNEVVEATKIPYGTVARVLRELTRTKRIKRTHHIGHSYRYQYLTDTPVDPKNKLNTPININSEPSVKKFKSSDLYDILVDWSENDWAPGVTRSTRDLMYVLAKLYKYAIYAAKGNSVEDDELDPARQRLEKARLAAENYLEFINSLLAENRLWRGSEFSTFLLEGADLDSVNDHAHNVESYSHTK